MLIKDTERIGSFAWRMFADRFSCSHAAGVWGFRSRIQVGLPHIRAHEDDLGDDLFAHGSEESLKGLDGSFLAHPEQSSDAKVDLIDQRQVLVAFGVLDFIHQSVRQTTTP